MFPLYILSGLLSLGLVVHCIKTHRNTIWVYVLVVLMSMPFVGAAAYVAAELLPEWLGSRTSRRAMRGIRSSLDPEANLRRFENEMKVTGNVASRQKYADELVKLGRAKEAVQIYKTCLTGVFADDPKLLLGYANAQFEAGDAAGTRQALDVLIEKNPEFKSADGHLLYARALEAEGNVEKALSEYATLAEYFAGAEAGVRYARLLIRSDQRPLAQQTLKALLDRAKYAPAHYRKAQREWLDEAHRELQNT
ncbi:MAG TPA: tetratricopeptide repeat protein [Steroidobacteraceae bacterium]|nr:tetratricopeptide repeat protein [Steroidobacteraceae bacterium]